jgi:hypothetical protein
MPLEKRDYISVILGLDPGIWTLRGEKVYKIPTFVGMTEIKV